MVARESSNKVCTKHKNLSLSQQYRGQLLSTACVEGRALDPRRASDTYPRTGSEMRRRQLAGTTTHMFRIVVAETRYPRLRTLEPFNIRGLRDKAEMKNPGGNELPLSRRRSRSWRSACAREAT